LRNFNGGCGKVGELIWVLVIQGNEEIGLLLILMVFRKALKKCINLIINVLEFNLIHLDF
jgi:hypothetical protein